LNALIIQLGIPSPDPAHLIRPCLQMQENILTYTCLSNIQPESRNSTSISLTQNGTKVCTMKIYSQG